MRRKLIYGIFLIQAFILNLSNVIMPSYIQELGLQTYHFGYFIALWSLGMLLSSPVWGWLGDLYGRRKFIIIGLIIYAVTQAVCYYSSNVSVIYIMRVFSGIGVGAPITLLLSYLVRTAESTAVALSKRMAYITIGGTLSYKIAGELALTIDRELFLIQSILTILFIILTLYVVEPKQEPHCVFPKQANMIQGFAQLSQLQSKNILFLLSITLTTMTFINMDKFIDVLLLEEGHTTAVVGNVKMVFGFVTIGTNFYLVPKLKQFIGNIFVLQTIEIIMAIIVLITFQQNELLIALYSVYLGYVVLRAIYTTSEQLFLSKQVDPSEMGLFMGLRQSFASLGMLIGPIIGGYIYSINPMNLFSFCVICLLCSSVILSVIKSPESFLNKALTK